MVREALEVADDFNAIGSCLKKEYTYRIYNSRIKNPFYVNRAYSHPKNLDEAVMDAAARAFEGTHDFRAVRSVGTETKTTVRTVHYCRVTRPRRASELKVCADGFLQHGGAPSPARCHAAEGKLTAEDIPKILDPATTLAGPTVPPGDCTRPDFGMRMNGSMTDKDKLSARGSAQDRCAATRRGTLHRILVLVAVLAVVLGSGARRGVSYLSNFDSLRRALSYDKADAAGENTYDYDNDRTNRFALLGDRLLVVSTTRVSVLADDGSEVYAQEVKLDSPAIASSAAAPPRSTTSAARRLYPRGKGPCARSEYRDGKRHYFGEAQLLRYAGACDGQERLQVLRLGPQRLGRARVHLQFLQPLHDRTPAWERGG